MCFFEPAWPLFYCASSFWFPFDFAIADGDGNVPDAVGSTDVMPVTNPFDKESQAPPMEAGSPEPSSNPGPPMRGQDLDPGLFLLILKNGTEHVVTSYWLSDGYVEYVNRDSTQSHIPVDSLDLPETVRNNSARGLSFVLRSTP